VPYDVSNETSVSSAFASMPRMGAALHYFWSWGQDGCVIPDNFMDATTSKR